MDKEAILSKLGEALGATQLSGQTLAAYVEGNLPSDGAEPDDAYFARHAAFLKTLEGNYNRDVGERVRGFKEEWERAHPAPKGGEETPEKDDAGLAASLAEMRRELDGIRREREDSERRRAADELRSAVKGRAESLKVTNRALWDDVAGALDVGGDSTEDSLLAEAKSRYETKLKAYTGGGAEPYGGTRGGVARMTQEERAAAARAAADKARRRMV